MKVFFSNKGGPGQAGRQEGSGTNVFARDKGGLKEPAALQGSRLGMMKEDIDFARFCKDCVALKFRLKRFYSKFGKSRRDSEKLAKGLERIRLGLEKVDSWVAAFESNCLASGKYSGAFPYFKAFASEGREQYYLLKSRLLASSSPQAGIDFLSECIAGFKSGALFIERGYLYVRHFNDYESAIPDFTSACELSPLDPLPYYSLASAQLRKGEVKDSLANSIIAINLDGNHPAYHYLRGQAHVGLSEFELALESLDTTLALGASSPDIYLLRAFCKDKMGDLKGSFMEADIALSLFPGSLPVISLWHGLASRMDWESKNHG
ncbi:MAG: hypothetical protein WC506_03585 [Candidatus Micrarchaeia archaeon]